MSDSETVEFDRWRGSRDTEAFQALVSRHAPMVYATCQRVLGNASEAEDAAQETFEVLVKAGREPVRRLGPWLHRVATNLALKRVRSGQRRARWEQAYTEQIVESTDHSWDDVYEYVDEAVNELSALQRDAVVAHYLQGRTQKDLARDSGVSPQAISKRIRQGLDTIAESLKKRGVVIGAAALGELFAVNAAKAGPLSAALFASLGKIALSQAGGVAATASAVPALIGLKTGAIVTLLAVLSGAGLWVITSSGPAEKEARILVALDEDNDVSPEEAERATELRTGFAASITDEDSAGVDALAQTALDTSGEQEKRGNLQKAIVGGPHRLAGDWVHGPRTAGQNLHALDERGSVAWSLMRQWNMSPLLRRLSHGIRPLLDSSRRHEPAWVGEESGATVELTIEFEDDIESEVYVGFFKDASWSAEPEQIRSFDGPGTYIIETIPVGSYVFGAMTKKGRRYPDLEYVPFAIGVQENWPNPVRVREGSTTQVRLLLAKAFHSASQYMRQGISLQMDGIWEPVDPDNLIQGKVTDPDRQPIASGHVGVREHRPGAGSIAAPDIGIDPDGWYFFDGLKWPYRVFAEWNEVNPTEFSSRSQNMFHEQVLEGPATIHFQFDPFPTGTAVLSGQVVDQTGAPVQNTYVSLSTIREDDVSPSVWYRFPFMNEKGAFEIRNMPADDYYVRALPFDMVAYGYSPGRGDEISLIDGETAEVNIKIERKGLFHGRILFSDGTPAVPDAPIPDEMKTRVWYEAVPRPYGGIGTGFAGNLDKEGYFAIDLTKERIETLKSGGARLTINFPVSEDGSSEQLGEFPFDVLGSTREEAGTVVIE